MGSAGRQLVASPGLCNALRQAARAVTRLYDDELRVVGVRTTQYIFLTANMHIQPSLTVKSSVSVSNPVSELEAR
jgi:hypothetical protein